ncbi:hypothetical protein J6590_043667 [Homalodisca vitripennis]|nr:hypothetical protein J6590_043667 [Homalodisca vitripennis]
MDPYGIYVNHCSNSIPCTVWNSSPLLSLSVGKIFNRQLTLHLGDPEDSICWLQPRERERAVTHPLSTLTVVWFYILEAVTFIGVDYPEVPASTTTTLEVQQNSNFPSTTSSV